MKIIISNTVGCNGGDAAILLAAMDLCRDAFGPELEFVVYDSLPAPIEARYPGFSVRRLVYERVTAELKTRAKTPLQQRLFLRCFRMAARYWNTPFGRLIASMLSHEDRVDLEHYMSADLVLTTGGTYLVENYPLAPRIFDFQLTLAAGKPLVFLTQSMGPFRRDSNRRVLPEIFERAALILLRDEESLHHLRELGVTNPNVQVGADVAFLLGDVASVEHISEGSQRTSPTSLRVAISVREWGRFSEQTANEGMRRYCDAVRDAVVHLVSQYGAAVTFISTCQGIPEYWTDDSRTAEHIVAPLPEEVRRQVVVDRDFHTPHELIRRFREVDVVIATRMHAAILASLAGAMVLPIAYEFKTAALFERMGLSEWVLDIDTVTGESLRSTIDGFLANRETIGGSLRSGVAKERARAAETVDWLATSLLS